MRGIIRTVHRTALGTHGRLQGELNRGREGADGHLHISASAHRHHHTARLAPREATPVIGGKSTQLRRAGEGASTLYRWPRTHPRQGERGGDGATPRASSVVCTGSMMSWAARSHGRTCSSAARSRWCRARTEASRAAGSATCSSGRRRWSTLRRRARWYVPGQRPRAPRPPLAAGGT
jgi:hypothetical protein